MSLPAADFQRWEHASGSSKEQETSMAGVSDIAACPPSPTDDDPSALPSPISPSPSSSQ